MAEISLFHPDMLIWIDEAGSDGRNSIMQVWLLPQRHTSSGISTTCWRKVHLSNSNFNNTWHWGHVETIIDGERFEKFLCQYLLPIIMPYNGVNSSSVMLLDNTNIHHLARVSDIITGIGVRLVFLPLYSPDLMPLEKVFAEVKALLWANNSIILHQEYRN